MRSHCKDISHLIEGFVGVIVNIKVTLKVTSKVAVFGEVYYQTWYIALENLRKTH